MLTATHVREGLRYFSYGAKRKLLGAHRFSGSARSICDQIINRCWNGTYFRNSAGHYREFWCRDFGFTVDALLRLGQRERVLKTLAYALETFSAHGRIETTISPSGVPFSFPDVYSPDSVAYLFHALRAAKAQKLVAQYKQFLQNEVKRFVAEAIDAQTGLIKRKTLFSGMRDYAVRDSSCYDNVMAAFLSNELDALKLDNPLKKLNIAQKIKETFWNGRYFRDDQSGATHVTSDANLLPFWTGVITDKSMLASVIGELERAGLASPFPLRYVHAQAKEKMIWLSALVPQWEHDTVWSHIGLLYLQVLKTASPARYKKHLAAYKRIVQRDKTLFELFTPQGKPYKSVWYMADEAMLWAANLRVLL